MIESRKSAMDWRILRSSWGESVTVMASDGSVCATGVFPFPDKPLPLEGKSLSLVV